MRNGSLTIVLAASLIAAACGSQPETAAPAQDATQRGAVADPWETIGLPQPAGVGQDITGPYNVVEGWPQNHCGAGMMQGSVSGIFAETQDRVFIYARGCMPEITHSGIVPARNMSGFDLSQADSARHPTWTHVVTIVDRNGALVDYWEQHNAKFVRPHRVKVNPRDPERHVWIVDDGAHMVYKFTPTGELVQEWGTFGVAGNDETHFGRPTDIAWLPDGSFFISDGYTNTRVVKFSPEGKFLLQWGERGEAGGRETRPSYFNTVHGVAIDAQNRVYIADRANRRVQVFDENGTYLREWYTYFPYYIHITADQHLWAADGNTNKISKFDLNGKLLYEWGTFGTFPGGFWGVHQFSVDEAGNFYTADVHIGRAQKFSPKPGVNPALLVGGRGETAW